jgi:hypothetical protein
MTEPRDPAALVRHAIESGDRRLAQLLVAFLTAERGPRSGPAGAYLELCRELGLAGAAK